MDTEETLKLLIKYKVKQAQLRADGSLEFVEFDTLARAMEMPSPLESFGRREIGQTPLGVVREFVPKRESEFVPKRESDIDLALNPPVDVKYPDEHEPSKE